MSNNKKEQCKRCGAKFTNHGEYIKHINEKKCEYKMEFEPTFSNQFDVYKSIRDIVVSIHLSFRAHKLYPKEVADHGFIKFRVEEFNTKKGKLYGVYCDYRPDTTMMFIQYTILKLTPYNLTDFHYKDRVYGDIYYNKKFSERFGVVAFWQTPCTESPTQLLEYWEKLRNILRDHYEVVPTADEKKQEEEKNGT